jgi:hypothetical protein
MIDPSENPIGTELVFEDDTLRVWRIDMPPGATADWHTHQLDYISVIIEGDVIERPNADGSVDRLEVKPGDFMRSYQGPLRHMLRNIGERRFRNVVIEIKNTSTGA